MVASHYHKFTIRLPRRKLRIYNLNSLIEHTLSSRLEVTAKLSISSKHLILNGRAFPFHRQIATLRRQLETKQRLRFSIYLPVSLFRKDVA